MTELETKLGLMRRAIEDHRLGGLALRGVDWFAWGTCGGSSAVILTDEIGVAELLVTADGAWVLTDGIEAQRLADEELPAGLELWAHPWHADAAVARREFVSGKIDGPLASDRPGIGERSLPEELLAAKRRLLPPEIERYRLLGAAAAAAMTEVMTAARPEWSERQLAGAGAEALWGRGIHPALTLAAGARRLPLHRHPTPGPDPLGERAMLVFCGRRWGLYANLTRFVAFGAPTAEEERLFADVAAVEAAAWAASTPGASLAGVYEVLRATYAGLGYRDQIDAHHQGGTTGYLSREVVARPHVRTVIESDTALAWNPSLPGVKIEDTILVSGGGIEILTADPVWPAAQIAGRPRPLAYRA